MSSSGEGFKAPEKIGSISQTVRMPHLSANAGSRTLVSWNPEWVKKGQLALCRALIGCITAADTLYTNSCNSRQTKTPGTKCHHPCTGSPYSSDASMCSIFASVSECRRVHWRSQNGDQLQESVTPVTKWGHQVICANGGHATYWHLSTVIEFFVSISIVRFDVFAPLIGVQYRSGLYPLLINWIWRVMEEVQCRGFNAFYYIGIHALINLDISIYHIFCSCEQKSIKLPGCFWNLIRTPRIEKCRTLLSSSTDH